MNKQLAVLVVSCDKYSDLWTIFFDLMKKNWPDCEYKVYLGTNNLQSSFEGVNNICIGPDRAWADNVKAMIDQIDEDYILMLLEDFFIDRKIDSQKIKSAVKYAEENDIDCLRLEPLPPPVRVEERKLCVGKLNPKAPYFVSTQPAIWKKEKLFELLKEGYSAWDFEQKNSMQCSVGCNYEFYGTKKYIFHHKNGVERGKYYLSTINMLKKNGLIVDTSERGIIKDNNPISKVKLLKYKLYMLIKRIKAEI